MRKSPDRGSFQRKNFSSDQDPEITAIFMSMEEQRAELEASDEWRRDNLEYDLRSTDWVAEKCENEVYAQNLYAALCNNEFIKNAVWPLLQGKTWSCSWRSAGGIIANIRQEGDYIDWYCSGIRNRDLDDEAYSQLDEEQQEFYNRTKLYVSESVVTDEIREDLLKLGWLVIEDINTTI